MKRLLGGIVAVITLLSLGLAQANAQQDSANGTGLAIRSVDSRSASAVQLVVDYAGPAADLASAELIENGQSVTPAAVEVVPGDANATVIVVDTSAAMEASGGMVQAREAASAYIRNRDPQERVAIVSLGGQAREVQRLTTDTDRLLVAVEGLAADGESALWDGLRSAARILENADTYQRNVVLVAGGSARGATISASQARGALVAAKASLYAVGLEGRGLDVGSVRAITQTVGGVYHGQENPTALGAAMEDVAQQISGQQLLTFASVNPSGPIDLVLKVGNSQATASYVTGGFSVGPAALTFVGVSTASGGGFLGEYGLWIGLLLVLAAVALAVYAIGALVTREPGALDIIDTYVEGPAPVVDEEEGGTASVVKTAFLKRAVNLTEGLAEQRNMLTKVEGMLERANLPLRAGEALFFYLAGAVLLLLAILALSGNALVALIVGGMMILVPPAVVNFLASRRQKAFQAQLPDTLQMLAGTLRAGYSLMQGVEAVSVEVSEPMGRELRRIVTEARLGRPLEEAMEASAERMASKDFDWAVLAIGIQREVGGNLAELLLTVADTMVQRERLRRDVDALTAEGRISGIVLGILPVALGVAMWILNPDYIGTLFEDPVGNIMLVGAALLALGGFYWMKKVIEVDV
ncbi:MAG: type II secretion system F family protein [Acidimicrobiia bacterium]